MTKPAIECRGIGKSYRIGLQAERYGSFRDMLAGVATAPLRRFKQLREHRGEGKDVFWALRDISFAVQRGEAVGIIGANGAGKSTLLKILSRITFPTEGVARIHGRVGSLLEVGTGFHPELTGRENIYLNGAILGMLKAEIDERFKDIVEFSGMEKFLDTPVKRYSSGMAVRLAFAVAAHLEPEILIVDEVLAVGDARFQKKCLQKMSDVSGEGRTVLFVSHNMSAIQSFCQTAIWLEGGKIKQRGEPAKVVADYLQAALTTETEHVWTRFAEAPGTERVRIHRAAIRPARGSNSELITTRTPLDIEFDFWNRSAGARLNLSVQVAGKEGSVIFNTGPSPEKNLNGERFPVGLFRSGFRVPGDLLNDGFHRVLLMVVENQHRIIYRHQDILVFNVLDDGSTRGSWHGDWAGAVRPLIEWRPTELLEKEPA